MVIFFNHRMFSLLAERQFYPFPRLTHFRFFCSFEVMNFLHLIKMFDVLL